MIARPLMAERLGRSQSIIVSAGILYSDWARKASYNTKYQAFSWFWTSFNVECFHKPAQAPQAFSWLGQLQDVGLDPLAAVLVALPGQHDGILLDIRKPRAYTFRTRIAATLLHHR
jgi:hypothetical protein